MFSPSDVKLTNVQIMLLAATISGGDNSKRAADKPSAISAFTKALGRRIGEEKAIEFRTSVLMCETFLEAHNLLGEVVAGCTEERFAEVEELIGCELAEEEKEESHQIVDEEAAKAVINTREEANMIEEKKENRRGRKSAYVGKQLTAVGDGTNPRRAGTHGFKSHQIILDKPGITNEEFLALGGRANDLKWDIDHGSVVAA